MAHGYMREYDEDFRGEDRERSERDWRSDDERRWREQGRDRGMLFGDRHGRDEDRGFFGRLGDGARESFRDDDQSNTFGRSQDFGDQRRFSSHPDDHYRSWRDKQVQALDQDYADYCREREQQFHSDFDSWRQQRGNPGPLRTGMTQTGLSADPSGVTQAEAAANVGTSLPDPMDAATLGTTPRSRTKS